MRNVYAVTARSAAVAGAGASNRLAGIWFESPAGVMLELIELAMWSETLDVPAEQMSCLLANPVSPPAPDNQVTPTKSDPGAPNPETLVYGWPTVAAPAVGTTFGGGGASTRQGVTVRPPRQDRWRGVGDKVVWYLTAPQTFSNAQDLVASAVFAEMK